MMLRFTTDGSVTRSGFSATFSCATTMGTSCGADMVVNLNERGSEGTERFSTTGKNNDFNPSCGGEGPEMVFRYDLMPGSTIEFQMPWDNYDSRH